MIKFENVRKEFKTKKNETLAVDNVNLEINEGEIFGIIGFSGAGKSTLVRCINLLEVPTSGNIYFKNENLLELTGKQLRQYRRKVGMIFQQFNLLEQKNVLDNICYPLLISGVKKKDAKQKAYELLELVEMSDKAKSYPSQLSGGQKQRVAIARALATQPEVLLCDEATSALDPITTKSILQLLKDINQKLKVTIVVITHELKVVETICDRVAVMSAGKVEEVETVKELFLNPKSETARKLILSSGADTKKTSEKKSLRIVFEGQAASEPIISKLTLNTNMMINILGANTEDIGGKAYGQMLIEIPSDETKAKTLKDELIRMGIHVEEG